MECLQACGEGGGMGGSCGCWCGPPLAVASVRKLLLPPDRLFIMTGSRALRNSTTKNYARLRKCYGSGSIRIPTYLPDMDPNNWFGSGSDFYKHKFNVVKLGLSSFER